MLNEAMKALASQYGGTYAPLVTWQLFKRPFTVHSLGGAHLADGVPWERRLSAGVGTSSERSPEPATATFTSRPWRTSISSG